MKRILCIAVFSFLCIWANAQFTVRIIVTEAATKKGDDYYIAGDFNKWNPGDYTFKLKPFGAVRRIYVFKNMAAGKLAFKFTRGSWDRVESTAKGEDLDNHEVEITGDTTFNYAIAGWKDDFPDKPKPNTATAQVKIIDTAFFVPQLNRYRRIWIYLPKTYPLTKGKYYPVLYMHDGQNLFNEQTAFAGEWGVDECLDSLQQQLKKDCIVVGIDNDGQHRMTEYNPYDNDKFGKAEGDKYADFVAKILKPYIDKNYRTMKDPQHTFIAGSSMGGLISLYTLMKYPDIFGSAGIFSPAFWVGPRIFETAQQMKWKGVHRVFLYAGQKENDDMVPDTKRMADILADSKAVDEQDIVFPLGQHNESYWRKVFPAFYTWLMEPVAQ